MKRLLKTLCLSLVVSLAVSRAFAAQQLYTTVLRSTAYVLRDGASGSGELIDAANRLVLTNAHVVGDQTDVAVIFPAYNDGRLIAEQSYYNEHYSELAIHGHVTRVDARRDLALIELDSLPDGVTEIPLATESAGPGDAVHSIGNPEGTDALWIYTRGTVRSSYHKTFSYETGQEVDCMILETDAPINHGDSGGPVVNDNRELIGVNAAFTDGVRLISLCIDVSEVRSFLDGDNKTIDPGIQAALDGAGLSYTVDTYGVFEIPVQLSEDVTQNVFVNPHATKVASLEMCKIYAVALTSTEEFSSELRELVLEDNWTTNLGDWEVVNNEGTYFLVFCVKCPKSLDSATIKDLALGVAAYADNLRTNLAAAAIEEEVTDELPVIDDESMDSSQANSEPAPEPKVESGRAGLGITLLATWDRPGLFVQQVLDDSGAAAAGLHSAHSNGRFVSGDVILAIDGVPMFTPSDLCGAMARHAVGDTLAVTFCRDGRRFTVEVTLTSVRGSEVL